MKITLIMLLLLGIVSSARAASYQKTDSTIVDPIQISSIEGGNHGYDGENLEPNADLVGVDLHQASLIAADLAGADMTGAILTDTWMADADFSNAVLLNANLDSADIMGAVADNANLRGADLRLAHALESSFREADFTGATLTTLDGRDADFYGAMLANVTMDMAELTGADLRNACLTCANITMTNFRGADLWQADFTNAYYYEPWRPEGDFNWDAMGVLRMTWPEVPEVCRVAAVPESRSLWLAIPALGCLLLRRRRIQFNQ